MAVFLHVVTYLALAAAAIAVAARALRILRMPLHLRWELYPVPKEGARARHGGSYFEDVDWWKKKRHESFVDELKAMIPEMVFIKALWESNRKLWFRSFPFHFGLYLLIGCCALLVAGALTTAVGAGAGLLLAIERAAAVLGLAGLALGTLGAVGLLVRRLTDDELTGYTSFRDVFNLAVFLAAFGLTWAGVVARPGAFSALAAYVRSLVRGDLHASVSGAGLAGTILMWSFLVAYVPMTHMSHFFTKYFTYHMVRWQDAPNLRGGSMEPRIARAVQYPVTWSAPHINADGKKNWVDIATEEVPRP